MMLWVSWGNFLVWVSLTELCLFSQLEGQTDGWAVYKNLPHLSAVSKVLTELLQFSSSALFPTPPHSEFDFVQVTFPHHPNSLYVA